MNNMATVNTDKTLTTTQAAEMLGLSKETVKKYCQNGAISAVKFGRSWLIEPSEVKRYKKESLGKQGRPKK
jgi:excisionase family DNA binding protein